MASWNHDESSFMSVELQNPKQYALANKYFTFFGNRTDMEEKNRYTVSFNYKKKVP